MNADKPAHGGTPWYCANCTFVPDEFEANPRPCPRCGCVEFRRGSLLVRLKTPADRFLEMCRRPRTVGLHAASFTAGPTVSDRSLLRFFRIGWTDGKEEAR